MTILIFAVAWTLSEQIWPLESPPLNLGEIDASPESDAVSDPGRVYAKGDFNVRLRDGLRASDGLEALYRALLPKESLHNLARERTMLHPSKVNLVLGLSTRLAMRTYATLEGSLSISVTVYANAQTATQDVERVINGGAGSGPGVWKSPAFEFGDASWMPTIGRGTAFVRDGRIVTSVSATAPPGIESPEYLESIVQAVRFRLMVASQLLNGCEQAQLNLSTGATIQVRNFEGTRMVSLQELAKTGLVSEASGAERLRKCTTTRANVTVNLTEYGRDLKVGNQIRRLPIAPFAYAGDLWVPLGPVIAEFGITIRG